MIMETIMAMNNILQHQDNITVKVLIINVKQMLTILDMVTMGKLILSYETITISFEVTFILVHIIISVFMDTGSFKLDMCMVDIPTTDIITDFVLSKGMQCTCNPLNPVSNVVLLLSIKFP